MNSAGIQEVFLIEENLRNYSRHLTPPPKIRAGRALCYGKIRRNYHKIPHHNPFTTNP